MEHPLGPCGGVLANFHYGLDLSSTTAASGGTVVAATDMKITIARENDGQFGTRVNGTTLDGKLTIGHYHLAAGSLKVKVGDTVAAGDAPRHRRWHRQRQRHPPSP